MARVTSLLESVDGVANVQVNFEEKKAIVTGEDLNQEDLVKVINNTGDFKAQVID